MSEDRETEFTHYGVDYVAVESDGYQSCVGCAFYKMYCTVLGLPSCHPATRQDKTSKIFVVK